MNVTQKSEVYHVTIQLVYLGIINDFTIRRINTHKYPEFLQFSVIVRHNNYCSQNKLN